MGFVFTNWTEVAAEPETDSQMATTSVDSVYAASEAAKTAKAILDCGASESIVGIWTLQHLSDELAKLGFDPDQEIHIDKRFRKTFVFGNNESSEALGHAKITAGIHGLEQALEAHVVEGQTPFLLSSKWLYEQKAIVDFGAGQAFLPYISNEVVQLERAPTHHLLLPVTAFQGHDTARDLTKVKDEDAGPLLRACAQMLCAADDKAVQE